jgi:hypothetical protein
MTAVIAALMVGMIAAQGPAADGGARTLTYNVTLGDKPLGRSKYNAALWLESTDGTLLATVYVNETAAREEKKAADKNKTYETLPVWSRARRAQAGRAAPAAAAVDAITGATVSTKSLAGTYAIPQDVLQRAAGGAVTCFLEIDVAWEKEPSYIFRGNVDLSAGGPVELAFGGLGGVTGVSASERGKSAPSEYVKSAVVEATGASIIR